MFAARIGTGESDQAGGSNWITGRNQDTGKSAQRNARNPSGYYRARELIEKIWSKVHANTLQLEKVKEDVKECAQVLKMTDYDKAVRFLKETLAGGRIDGAEVLRMADATGIKRADLNKAKRDIGVDTAQTGYGKNQKTWWFLSE